MPDAGHSAPAGQHAVLIAGGGPTGLMLAAELALAKVDVAVVERRTDQTVPNARAGGLQARGLEVLEQRGVARRFLAQGQPMQLCSYAQIPLSIADFPARHPYGLVLDQERIERLLSDWAEELGVRRYRGREITGVTQDPEGVDLHLAHGERLRGHYLVGCDGGRSGVRRAAGIEFAGWDASVSYLIAEALLEVEAGQHPPWGMRRHARGVHAVGKIDGGKRVRIVLAEEQVNTGAQPTLPELRAALVAAYGSDYGVHDVTWLSRFSDAARQAVSYRAQRVLLAGDAAHVHSPTGGQGLNTGLQDAVNLGWKLAQVVHGTCPDSLLDSYHAERHPVAARVLRMTLAFTALSRGDERTEALRQDMAELLGLEAARKLFAARLSGLDIQYDLGTWHPLLGRRMPDLELTTAAGKQRVSTLLHAARPVLLRLGGPPLNAAAWTPRIVQVEAQTAGPWELPVVGVVPAPTGVLIRPDGHVAWVGLGGDQSLVETLTTWFGAPSHPP